MSRLRQTENNMKARFIQPLSVALLLSLTLHANAQEAVKADTLTKIQTVDTIEFQPLFTEEAPGLKVVRIMDNSTVKGPDMQLDRNGNAWKVFAVDGLDVLMNVRYLKEYGKYYRIDLYIQNNTKNPVSFSFDGSSVEARDGKIKLFSNRGYLNRVGARRTAKTIGLGVVTLVSSLVMYAIVRGDPDDDDSFEEELLRDIGSDAILEAGNIATAMITADGERQMENIRRKNIGYLKDFSIAPGSAIEGHAFAKYRKGADSIEISLPIGDKKYVFNWAASAITPVD